MKLRIVMPAEVALEQEATHVTVEDVTGSLGIRPGHAPLVTVLAPGVVIARGGDGVERYVAVNGGVMVVDGETVEIVTRQAVPSAALEHLEETVVAGFRKEVAEDRTNRAAFEKMRIKLMRSVLEFDRAET